MDSEKVKVTKLVNIGVLDIRNTGSRDLGVVKMVNVGYVLHTPETFDVLKGGKRVNVGQFVEASPTARVLLSPTHFNDDYFSNQDSGLELLAFGPVLVDWETSPEAIERGLMRLDIFGGPLICPRHLLGTLQSKIRHQDAETIPYEGAEARLVMGKLVLDKAYLSALKDGSELVVVGSLKMPEVLPDDVITQKIKRLYVKGRITVHEENAAAIQATLGVAQQKIKIIPAGYTLVEKPLALNQLALESMGASKIYCTEWVQIDAQVSSEILDQYLDALVSEERVYCPAGLKDVIVQKCDWLKTRLELYAGELWVIEDERQLPGYAFDHLSGVATLVVFGALKLYPEITANILTEKLDKIHNFGSIHCTPEQMGAVQSLLGLNEGELIDTTQPKKEKPAKPVEDVLSETYVNSNYVSL